MNLENTLQIVQGDARGERERQLEEKMMREKDDRAYLADRLDERALSIIEERFQTSLPCFQGVAGAFDPLDAMRRDAYREVCLWLRGIYTQHNQ